MPRGNLETVRPRPLVLSWIAKALEKTPPDFLTAFRLCRRDRIDVSEVEQKWVGRKS